MIKKLEGEYAPTVLQSALGDPLRSEQRTGELLPRVLSRLDLLAIFIAIVLFIPNASIVQATQGAGPATYLYWILGAVTFLLPGAIVTGQLNRFIPVDGSIYVWTHRALGPLWGFFAGFCAWFPGILVLLAASDGVLTLLQGISVQVWGVSAPWLAPWQQGIVVLGILLVAGWLSILPLRLLLRLVKGIVLLYGVAILIVGLAGAIWLLGGHTSQVSLMRNTPGFGGPNIVLYGVIVLALLGVEVPLNMAAETRQPDAPRLFLRWGPWIVLLAYLLGTFGVMVVVPQNASGLPYSTLTAVRIVFGAPLSVLVGLVVIAFFIIVVVVYNVTFARILFVSALDHRLPSALARVNRHAAPGRAIGVQTIIALVIALFTYFLGPVLYPAEGANLSAKVYNLSQATTTVIWCISMAFLFLDLPLLLRRFRELLAKSPEQLIAPPWLLYLCCGIGGLASLLGIWTTLSLSWDSMLIPNEQWTIAVGIATLVCLLIGLLGSAYPRLLSSLDEQTAAARENAALYHELRTAYTRLSELDQLKDAFLTTASHELRTPLTIMQGYLELLREMEDQGPDVRRAFLDKVCRACDELVLLQANIMDASRLKVDTASLHCTRITLKEIVMATSELFEPWVAQGQQSIEVDVAANIMVWADEARLKQVLHNLLANAVRYSPPQTSIRIAVVVEQESHMSRMARISVSDQGSGIPPDKQEVIFDKFVRLERDMHGTVRGSGLGLYITRQLVEAMQGAITVQSSGVKGEGSTFSFTLPLADS
ncbi:MAG TPA: amino acid permease [Ktedonobacteraceae bacterium]|nr:amino acid permease [Ktedonobacteraceae bacterium]